MVQDAAELSGGHVVHSCAADVAAKQRVEASLDYDGETLMRELARAIFLERICVRYPSANCTHYNDVHSR